LWSEQQARDLHRAVTDANHGALTWIQGHW
jgi:hypothetical protein